MKHAVLIAALIMPVPLAAEGILGTWASPPDTKGQIGHVVMQRCGEALCGVLQRAFDPNGTPITTINVGKRLLWDVRPKSGGAYEGRAFVPVFGRDFPAQIALKGDRLEIRGCMAGAVCKSQVWRRVN